MSTTDAKSELKPISFATSYCRSLKTPSPRPSNTCATETAASPSSYLYHIILEVSRLQSGVPKFITFRYIVGTYTSLSHAIEAAQDGLFRAGFTRQDFKEYLAGLDLLHSTSSGQEHGNHVVLAIANDGTEFQIRVDCSDNPNVLIGQPDSHRVDGQLWHVVQTKISYTRGERRIDSILGTFTTYEHARAMAYESLCPEKSGEAVRGIVHYETTEAEEKGLQDYDRLLVRAVDREGDNHLVSLVKGHTLKSIRWVAAGRSYT